MTDWDETTRAYERNQMQFMPSHTLEALNLYLDLGIVPGSFLKAVLCNDLMEAYRCADDINIANMYAIVRHMYSNVPANAWGSMEKVHAYIKNKFEERKEKK